MTSSTLSRRLILTNLNASRLATRPTNQQSPNLHKSYSTGHAQTQHRHNHWDDMNRSRGDFQYNCSYPIPNKRPAFMGADEAMQVIKSGSNIYVQGVAATPTILLDALCRHAVGKDLKGVTLHHLHLEGDATWIEEPFNQSIRSNCMFIGHNLRKAVADGRADCMSIFLSEIPVLFRQNKIDLDVAFIHVSRPDRRGFCSLGTSVDCTPAAINNANHIIAVVNPNMPRTFGDGLIHSSHIDTMVYDDSKLYERPLAKASDIDIKIGQIIAEHLIEDGATLQMGIGAIPDAALAALHQHKDLGIHTEMFSDGILELVHNGAITNSHKVVQPGKIVSGFVYGSDELYGFLHDNPQVFMGDIAWVNDIQQIRKNPKVTAINSAVEIDLTGQVVADSVGKRMISGVGGQIDFIRGASVSHDGKGKPIIALGSIAGKANRSKIVPYLQEGAGVVTTRAHVHFIVTEYGIASMFGKNLRQRAHALIRIAHPDHREMLEKAAFERLKVMPSED